MPFRGSSGAYNLESIIQDMDSWGLTDVMLPFLLIFTIIFAILTKTKILGKDKKNFNMVVALAIGLLVVIPHVTNNYPQNKDPVLIINNSLPAVAIIIVALIMLLLLVGIFGGEASWTGYITGWVAIAAFIVVLIIFGGSAGWWDQWNWFYNFFGEDVVALIVILLVFGIIIAFITGESKDEKKGGAMKRVGDEIGRLFGGKD